MILDADMAQLEWRVGAQLSQDSVMIQEIVDGIDIHTDNALKFFGDIQYRQTSKTLGFRLLYGGSAYAFYMDSAMPRFSLNKWEKKVEEFYTKYSRLKQWQDENYKIVCRQGWYQSFTGRIYHFKPERQKDGTFKYGRPATCNFIVQGTSTGDLVPLAMIYIYHELKKRKLKDVLIINQVHDSLVLDSPSIHVEEVASICINTFRNLPNIIKKVWNYDWIVPLDGEVKVGKDWANMEKVKV